ncbi:MFS transporter [Elioraea sp. Yellowstone]|uniref:MFS transporter n=1 Tax=Elioraea sp. Yellowstone TaxID=2592070 RepID=UPI0011535797|nr:MFS transporter [Elioraea sp. Yellowstone]TQF83708.1 MFS transporter [Elioraea sp. Yellowstone]
MGALTALTALSNFHRATLGALAPELARDLALSPDALGLANGAFFLALGVMQIPVGLMFDRIGPRRTVALLGLPAVAGAALQAVAADPRGLIGARLLLGAGCGASFMASVVLCARWFGTARLASTASRIFAFSQIGSLAAGTPLAAGATLIGWRGMFAASAVLTGLVTLAFHRLVRDDPPGQAVPPRPHERFAAVLAGLIAVWRTPGLLPVLAMHTFVYASAATVLTLWAGPYLADVHGLTPVARGHVILAMAAAQAVGTLVVGPLDLKLNTRKWIVVPGACATFATLLGLAGFGHRSGVLAIGLLVLLCLVTCYSVVTVAHGRSLFPEALAGRGVTTVNLFQLIGSTVLPILAGAVVGAFPAGSTGARPAEAYAFAFVAIAGCLGSGLLVYLIFARDSRPRG